MSTATNTEKVLQMLEEQGVLRPKDLTDLGIPRSTLQRLYEKGAVLRVDRGLYTLPGGAGTEHQSLLEVAKKAPKAVICLLSALAYHRIGTQLPAQVWIAIGSDDRRPKVSHVATEIVRFSEESLRYGVEEHEIAGTTVRITSPAKTVADCFKFRRRVGLDVAIEAVTEGWRERRFTLPELRQAARVCRMERVMRPYVEAIQ